MTSEIKVGSFVIINEFDAPVCRLVAQVTEMLEETYSMTEQITWIVIARYLTEHTYLPYCSGRLERVTLVSDFGVEVTLTEKEVICEKKRPSQARYSDGRIREWQEQTVVARQPIRKTKGEIK